MSGQAAVAVAVSSVQVISSAISVYGSTPLTPVMSATDRDGKAEEESARIFFGVSALYAIATLLAYRWLASLPVYTKTMGALEDNLRARVALDEADELQALLPPALPDSAGGNHILRVLKTNFIYNFAVGYVFTVTLVSFLPGASGFVSLTRFRRLFTLRSLLPSNRRIQIFILYYSVLYTF